MNERSRAGVDQWIEDHDSPSIIGLCLDMGVDPGMLSDLVLDADYEWLRYAVYRIMAAVESKLFNSVTGLRDMLGRCERVVGQAIEAAPGNDSIDSWIAG